MYTIIKTTIHMFKHIHFTDICKRKSIVHCPLSIVNYELSILNYELSILN